MEPYLPTTLINIIQGYAEERLIQASYPGTQIGDEDEITYTDLAILTSKRYNLFNRYLYHEFEDVFIAQTGDNIYVVELSDITTQQRLDAYYTLINSGVSIGANRNIFEVIADELISDWDYPHWIDESFKGEDVINNDVFLHIIERFVDLYDILPLARKEAQSIEDDNERKFFVWYGAVGFRPNYNDVLERIQKRPAHVEGLPVIAEMRNILDDISKYLDPKYIKHQD